MAVQSWRARDRLRAFVGTVTAQAEYERVSESLFQAVNAAIVAAANASLAVV